MSKIARPFVIVIDVILALIVLIVAASFNVFASANTNDPSAAGYSASVVGGYTVTNIVYDLDDLNPTFIDEITFDINPSSGAAELAAEMVMIQTINGGDWKNYSLAPGVAPNVTVSCVFAGDSLTAASTTALNISASSTTNPAD